jgi:hypothetical protein
MAEQLFGHDPYQPRKGDYVGAYVSHGGTYVPLIIHVDHVDGNGSLQGSFEIDPSWPPGRQFTVGPFHAGRYSEFGTLHVDEDVVEVSGGTKLEVKFDGRFAAPTSSVGAIWGTVIVTAREQDGSAKEMATGTLAAAYTKKARTTITTVASGIWDDRNQ